MTNDHRIGKFIQDDQYMYNAYIGDVYAESRSLDAIKRLVAMYDDAQIIASWQKRPTFRWLDTDVVI